MMIIIYAVFFAFVLQCCNAQNKYLPMKSYQQINTQPCVRTLMSRQTIGCQGSKGLIQGLLYKISNEAELSKFLERPVIGKAFIPVLSYSLLNTENMDKLINSGKISGLVLMKDAMISPRNLSQDSVNPNLEFGLYFDDPNEKNLKWNSVGNGFLGRNFDFPIFSMIWNETDFMNANIGAINDALSFNEQKDYSGNPLYGLELDAFMWAAKDSEECLARNWCQPIGGASVWSTFSYNITASDKKPIIVLSSKFDSTALIHEQSFGAGQKSGVVALLSIAEALSHSPVPLASLPKHILFTFFNGESYGLSGSGRFVKDISSPFNCRLETENATSSCNFKKAACSEPCFLTKEFLKLNFDNIESVIELDTVGLISNQKAASTYYMHVDRTSNAPSDANLALLNKLAGSFKVPNTDSTLVLESAFKSPETTRRLPPTSSLMSFLLKKRTISGVVVSDYDFPFSNPFFNSELDVGNSWTADHVNSICGLSNQLARQVYSIASGASLNEVPASITANCSLVEEWLDCLTRNNSCALSKRHGFSGNWGTKRSAYVNVFGFGTASYTPTLIKYALLNYTKFSMGAFCNISIPCNTGFVCVPAINACVQSLTHYHDAYGTGLEYDYAQQRFTVVNASKPAWTESTWSSDTLRVRLYQGMTISYQWIQIGVGLGLTLIFGAGTFMVRKKIQKHLKVE